MIAARCFAQRSSASADGQLTDQIWNPQLGQPRPHGAPEVVVAPLRHTEEPYIGSGEIAEPRQYARLDLLFGDNLDNAGVSSSVVMPNADNAPFAAPLD
jgi:hypothetical protein